MKIFLLGIKDSLIHFFENEGFELNDEENGIFFKKNTEKGWVKLGILYDDLGENYRVLSIRFVVRMDSIEKKIEQALNFMENHFSTIYLSSNDIDTSEFNLTFGKNKNGSLHFYLDKTKEEVFEDFTNYVKWFYLNDVQTFITNCDSVQAINKQLNQLGEDGVSGFVSNASNSSFYRQLLIKILAEDPSALDYYNRIYGELEQLKGNATFDKIRGNFTLIKEKYLN